MNRDRLRLARTGNRTKRSILLFRLLAALTAGIVAAWAFAASASPQTPPGGLQPGDILVVDPDADPDGPPVNIGVLFRVDPQTGARTVLSSFGGTNPSAVAVEADGGILVTVPDAGTDPNGGTSEWGVLYRLTPDPVTGDLVPTVLTDFGIGADTGRNPRAVTVEADGQILVTTGVPGTLNDRPLLVRVDPVTGARAIVSDFRDSSQGVLGIEPRGVAVEAGGAILVIDAQGGPSALGELVRINGQTGFRTSVSRFNTPILGTNPTSVAVEATGQILVTDEGHLTTPLGLLFRIDPQSGLRTVLSDFNTGANTGSEPEGVAIEADGQILVIDKQAGPLFGGMLFRVDPQTGDRAIVSDFAVGPNVGGQPLALAVVPPRQGTLMVVNEVVNNNGGTASVSDWTMSVTGGNPEPGSFPGAEAPGTTVTLDPGSYSVSGSGPAGYTSSLSSGCSGTIAAGETKTCTVTADDLPARGTLFVITNVVNDDGGTLGPSDFTMRVFGSNPSPEIFTGEGAPGREVTLDPGSYNVAYGLSAGYSATKSPDCVGTIAAGEMKTCTVTVDDDSFGWLGVETRVVNDNGGTATRSDWTISVTGSNPNPAIFLGDSVPPGFAQPVRLDPGTYSVAAGDGPAGYTVSYSPECSGTIAARETRFCLVILDDEPGTLFVITNVVNDDGGTLGPSDFTMRVFGSNPSPEIFTGEGAPGREVTLDPGSYNVAYGLSAGYSATKSPDCVGTIAAGEMKTCTVTVDDQPSAVPTCDGKPATIVGTAGPNEIRGTSGNDVIVDLDGDNTVRGRGGSDTICTGPGNDQIISGDGADTIIDTGGQNNVQAGAGNDSVRTSDGLDRINAGGGADTILDTGGDNSVEGGAGNDAITTGAGNDTVNAGAGNDNVDAGEGNNTVNGQGGDDMLTTGAGDDRIDGGLGFDTCSPGAGNNTIRRCEA